MEKIAVLKRELEEAQKSQGEQHLDLAVKYEALAEAHYSKGDYEEAVNCFQDSFELHHAALGTSTELVIDTHYRICHIKRLTSADEDTTRALFDQNFAMRKEYDSLSSKKRVKYSGDELGPFIYMDSTMIYGDMAERLATKGSVSKAAEFYKRCLYLRREKFGPESGALPPVLSAYAGVLARLDRLEEAIKIMEEAISIYGSLYGRSNETMQKYIQQSSEYRRIMKRIPSESQQQHHRQRPSDTSPKSREGASICICS